MKNLFIIFMILLFSSTTFAANIYWVDDNGAAANWAACESDSELSGAAACTMAQANAGATAGHTINIRTGTYTTGIDPANDGTNNTTRIIYQSYNNEIVTIDVSGTAINLDDRDYITITGSATQHLMIDQAPKCLEMDYGTYNIFAYITATGNSNYETWDWIQVGYASQYNWFHHCSFSKAGDYDGGDDRGHVMSLGWDANDTGDNKGNLVEDCEIFHGGHLALMVGSKYNVVRNNYLHNEEWLDGYGTRPLVVQDRDYANGNNLGWNLIEHNRIAYGYKDPDQSNNYTQGMQANGSHDNIFRRNMTYGNHGPGWQFIEVGSGVTPKTEHNYIYNNVFFYNGVDQTSYNIGLYLHMWSSDKIMDNTVIKNNIFEDNIGLDFYETQYVINTVMEGNYRQDAGDPLFTDAVPANTNDPEDDDYPDFTLQSGSPCIDTGTYLTQTNGTGTDSATLIVDDAHYFFSGDGSPWNQPSWMAATGDYIFVTGWAAPIEIESINYTTNTITLASVATWTDENNVYLAYSSTVGFFGTAPDQGAYEYALQVHTVSPTDGGTGISITAPATWDYESFVDDVEVWLDLGACDGTPDDAGADGLGDESSADADKTYNMSTLLENTAYCLTLVANDGALQGTFQQFDFTTTEGPPAPPAGLAVGVYHSQGLTGVYDDQGSTVGE